MKIKKMDEIPHLGGFFSLIGLRRLGLLEEANCYSLPYILASLSLNPKILSRQSKTPKDLLASFSQDIFQANLPIF